MLPTEDVVSQMLFLVHEPEEPNIYKYSLIDAQIFSIRSSKMLTHKGRGLAKTWTTSVYKQDSASVEDNASNYAPP